MFKIKFAWHGDSEGHAIAGRKGGEGLVVEDCPTGGAAHVCVTLKRDANIHMKILASQTVVHSRVAEYERAHLRHD
jgi:hypothetical protein